MRTEPNHKEKKKDSITRKIQKLAINGDTQFALENNERKFEFKIIEVAGETYVVFGSFGYLKTFDRFTFVDAIVDEFEKHLQKMGLRLEDCQFIDPFNTEW